MFRFIADWLINLLGGYTDSDIQEMNEYMEKWAKDNLDNETMVIKESREYIPSGAKVAVISSNLTASNLVVRKISVAPWCKNVKLYQMRTI